MIDQHQPTDIFHRDDVGSAPLHGRWDERNAGAGRRVAHWVDPHGTGAPIPGLGFRSGETLAFARSAREDRTQGGIGLVDYALETTGNLVATWVHPALGPQVGSGKATRTTGDADSFAGTFQIVYYDAGGAQAGPACDLRIERTPTSWSLTWFIAAKDRTLFKGVGLETDGRLLAAWGPPGDPGELVVLRPGDAGALQGLCVTMQEGQMRAETYSREHGHAL